MKAESYTSEALSTYYYVYDFHTIGFDIPGAPWWGFDIPEWRYTTGVKSSIWSRRNQSNFYDPASLYHPELRDLFNTATNQRWRLFSYEYIYYDYNNSIPAPDAAYLREYAPTNSGMTEREHCSIRASWRRSLYTIYESN